MICETPPRRWDLKTVSVTWMFYGSAPVRVGGTIWNTEPAVATLFVEPSRSVHGADDGGADSPTPSVPLVSGPAIAMLERLVESFAEQPDEPQPVSVSSTSNCALVAVTLPSVAVSVYPTAEVSTARPGKDAAPPLG